MENASKALLMAAGVLIGILILSFMVYLFASFTSTALQIERENNQKEITQFNANFTKYENKKDISIYSVLKLKNFVREVNENRNDDNKIQIYLESTEISGWNDTNDIQRVKTDLNAKDPSTGKPKVQYYKVTNIDYDENGKVNYIRFAKN